MAMRRVVPVPATAVVTGSGTEYFIDNKPIGTIATAIQLNNIEGAARGSIIRGNATPEWEALVLGGLTGSILTRDATDVLWSAFALAGTAGQTYTFPAASGSVPTGTGTAGRVVQWAVGGATLEDANLIAPANLLTLVAGGAYTLTVPETMTVAGRNVANTFTLINPLTTMAESWIGPSSTTGVYFKGGAIGFGTIAPSAFVEIKGTAATTPKLLKLTAANYSNDMFQIAIGPYPGMEVDFDSAANLYIKNTITGSDRDIVLVPSEAGKVRVNTTGTDAGTQTLLKLTALGTGSPGDGGTVLMAGKSSTAATQDMARIEWLWTDATHAQRNARIQLNTYPDGSALGHSGMWSGRAVTDTAETVIANGTGDVGKAITAQYVVYAITGADSSGGTVTLSPNSSFIIYDDATDELTLAVAADGSVTVQRTAGADTFDVTLWMVWM